MAEATCSNKESFPEKSVTGKTINIKIQGLAGHAASDRSLYLEKEISMTSYNLGEVVAHVNQAVENSSAEELKFVFSDLLGYLKDKDVPFAFKGTKDKPGQIRLMMSAVKDKTEELNRQRADELFFEANQSLHDGTGPSLGLANRHLSEFLRDPAVPQILKGDLGDLRQEVRERLNEVNSRQIDDLLAAVDQNINEAVSAIQGFDLNGAHRALKQVKKAAQRLITSRYLHFELKRRFGNNWQACLDEVSILPDDLATQLQNLEKSANRLKGAGTRGFAPGTGIGSAGKTARKKLVKNR